MKSHMRVRALCEGAVLVAVAQILSYLKLWEMPWGGSVVLSMIPLVLYAVRWGLGAGLLGGFAFGVLQFMFDGGFAIGWQSIVGDYLVAFTVLGLAGLVARRKSGVFTGTLIAGFSRFLVHYVVGATVWAEYMPETFFGMTMHSPWFYSLLYNLAYMLPNIAITLLVFAVAYKPLKKYFTASDLLKSDSEGTLVINRTMQQEYGLELGDIILRNMEVVGIIDDINYTSMRKPRPMGGAFSYRTAIPPANAPGGCSLPTCGEYRVTLSYPNRAAVSSNNTFEADC